jgi:hypothetical protein
MLLILPLSRAPRLASAVLVAACARDLGDDGAKPASECEGLPELVADADSGDTSLDLSFPDADCEDGIWYLVADSDHRPPERVTAGLWDLEARAFAGTSWDLEPDDSLDEWSLAIPSDEAGSDCASPPSTIFVFLPWEGNTLGNMSFADRGQVEGVGLYSGDTFGFHIDAPIGAADEGSLLVCEPGNGSVSHASELASELDGDEETWSADWEGTRVRNGWPVLFAGLLTLDGLPVAAAGMAED